MRDEQGKTQEESLRVFSEAASIYDRIGPRYFSHFGQRMVDLAQIVPGTGEGLPFCYCATTRDMRGISRIP